MWKAEWFYRQSGVAGDETIGPLSTKEISALCREGKISRSTLVTSRQATEGQWVPAASKSLLSHEIEEGEGERAVNATLASDYRKDQVRWFLRDNYGFFVGVIGVLLVVGVPILVAKVWPAKPLATVPVKPRFDGKAFLEDPKNAELVWNLDFTLRTSPAIQRHVFDPTLKLKKFQPKNAEPGDIGTIAGGECIQICSETGCRVRLGEFPDHEDIVVIGPPTASMLEGRYCDLSGYVFSITFETYETVGGTQQKSVFARGVSREEIDRARDYHKSQETPSAITD